MATLIDNKIDLAFISETWLSSQSNSVTAQIKMYGYELIHAFRDKRGGGVGILWKNSIKNHVRFSSVKNNFDTFQYQIIIFNGTTKTIFICIYRFQETPYSVFFEELNGLILQLDPCNPIIISGDFNFHFEKSELPEVGRLADVMSSHGFTQFVSGPTHKKGHTLDLLFANNHYFKFDDINPINFNISDHFPIFFDVSIRPNFVQQTKKQIVYKNFRNVDMSSFANSVSSDLAIAFETNLNESSFSEILKKYDSVVSEKNQPRGTGGDQNSFHLPCPSVVGQ